MTKPTLGGTLAALETAAAQRPRSRDLPLDLLTPDPDQPRDEFDEAKLEELAVSILETGVVEPLVVRPDRNREGHFSIIAGERRFRAAQRAGLAEVPCYIREDIEPQDVPLLQLVENLQREELGPLEVARGLQRALELNPKLNQTQLAKRIGRDAAFVSQHLGLLKTTGPTRAALESGQISSVETARQFQQLPEERQVELVEQKAPITRTAVARELRSVPPPSARPPASKKNPAAPLPAPAPPTPARRGRPARTDPADRRYHIPLTWRQIARLFERLGLPAPGSPEQAVHQLAAHLDNESER